MPSQDVTLVDLLDRLLAGGVVVQGQVTLAAAGIDLVDLDLRVLLMSVAKAAGEISLEAGSATSLEVGR